MMLPTMKQRNGIKLIIFRKCWLPVLYMILPLKLFGLAMPMETWIN